MVDRGRQRRLAMESLEIQPVERQVGVEDLDRDQTARIRIERPVYRPLCAGGDLFKDSVSADVFLCHGTSLVPGSSSVFQLRSVLN